MRRRPWTRDELIRALSLYFRLPFGQMHSRNPKVIELAKSINRTHSAVALKLVNFASLDPEHQRRGIAGMGNTSTADRSIWTEFYGEWDALNFAEIDIVETGVDHEEPVHSAVTEVVGMVRQRRGQSFFRDSVLAAYCGMCCVTGIKLASLLRASHIVPWSIDPKHRLDPRNGLCLNVLHDAAFDRGLITFDSNLELLLSRALREGIPHAIFVEMFESREGSPITCPERFIPKHSLLEYHRNHVFQQ